jgi:putative hydrolase of the HAD superfamily
MVRAVVFDWGGVLIEEPSSKIFRFCAEVLKVPSSDFQDVYRRFLPDFQRGLITENHLWEAVCSELRVPVPSVSSLWGSAIQHAYVERRGMFLLASSLRTKGYRVGLLSNTETPGMRFFQERQYSMFDTTVFSCAEGTRKPEERIYRILLQRLHLSAEEVCFIDDNQEYVDGAKRVGINAIVFTSQRQIHEVLSSLLG